MRIRDIRRDDRAAWEPLWRGYQQFYKVDIPKEVTDATFQRFFDGLEPVHALVAESDGAMLGLVHYIFHRSTWLMGPTCYLQDLFTAEPARGQGIATKLIEAVYERARMAGAARVYWNTHETNTTAQELYDKLSERSGFIQYRKVF